MVRLRNQAREQENEIWDIMPICEISQLQFNNAMPPFVNIYLTILS